MQAMAAFRWRCGEYLQPSLEGIVKPLVQGRSLV